MELNSQASQARKAYAIGIGICIAVLVLFAVFGAIEPTLAVGFGLDQAAPKSLPRGEIATIIGRIISAALSLIGVVFLVLMLYAGVMWMTARGNAERAEKAKDTIVRAIIGIIIVASAYAITSFVISRVTSSASSDSATPASSSIETVNYFAGIPTVHAQGLGTSELEKVGKESGISKTPGDAGTQLPVIVGNLVKAFISVLGLIFLFLVIYGGFLWLTARGEAERVEKAKSTLTRAIIGLVIIVSAYAITGFVLSRLVTATTAT